MSWIIADNGDQAGTVVVKTDQEAAIEFLVKEIVKEIVEERAEGRTLVEESPTKSSGSNGIVEREVQEIEGKIRSLFLALSMRLKVDIGVRERIVAFIP